MYSHTLRTGECSEDRQRGAPSSASICSPPACTAGRGAEITLPNAEEVIVMERHPVLPHREWRRLHAGYQQRHHRLRHPWRQVGRPCSGSRPANPGMLAEPRPRVFRPPCQFLSRMLPGGPGRARRRPRVSAEPPACQHPGRFQRGSTVCRSCRPCMATRPKRWFPGTLVSGTGTQGRRLRLHAPCRRPGAHPGV